VAHGVVISERKREKKEKEKEVLSRFEPATYRMIRLPSYPLGQDVDILHPRLLNLKSHILLTSQTIQNDLKMRNDLMMGSIL